MLAGAVALMLWYSVPLTLVTRGARGGADRDQRAGRRAAVAARETEVSARNASFVASLKDLLGGFPLVKSFGAEGPAARQFAASNRER